MTSDKDEPNILDCRELTCDQLTKNYERLTYISRALMDRFPDKESFKTHLATKLDLKEENLDNHNFTHQEFKNVMDNIIQSFGSLRLKKHDIEGFYSSFLYNKHGYVNIQEIAKTLYEDNSNKYFEKASFRKRGHPPIKDIALDPNFQVELEKDENDIKTNTQNPIRNRSQSQPTIHTSQLPADKDLQGILQQLDDKLYSNSIGSYKAFKLFDSDNDGYVSQKEFVDICLKKALVNREDLPKLLEYLDPSNKGYVDFPEFQNKIRRNMVQQNEKGEPLILPTMNPSKMFLANSINQLSKTSDFFTNLKKKYEPIENMKVTTRYESAPPWKNTFLHMQAASNSALFVSEEERFDRSHFAKTGFQMVEKDRKMFTQNAKFDRIRKNQDEFNQRLNDKMNFEDKKEKQKTLYKQLSQTIYNNREPSSVI
jgi:hypothetical protein